MRWAAGSSQRERISTAISMRPSPAARMRSSRSRPSRTISPRASWPPSRESVASKGKTFIVRMPEASRLPTRASGSWRNAHRSSRSPPGSRMPKRLSPGRSRDDW